MTVVVKGLICEGCKNYKVFQDVKSEVGRYAPLYTDCTAGYRRVMGNTCVGFDKKEPSNEGVGT
jgi:hypothetical protein